MGLVNIRDLSYPLLQDWQRSDSLHRADSPVVDYGDALDQHGAGQVGEADVGQYEVVGLGQQLLPLTQGIEDHQVEEDTEDIAAL